MREIEWTEIEPWGPFPGGDIGGDWQDGESWNRRWYRPTERKPGEYLAIDEYVYVALSPSPEVYAGPPEHYIAHQTELYLLERVPNPERIQADDFDCGIRMGTVTGHAEGDVELSEDGARAFSAGHRQPLQHTWSGERR